MGCYYFAILPILVASFLHLIHGSESLGVAGISDMEFGTVWYTSSGRQFNPSKGFTLVVYPAPMRNAALFVTHVDYQMKGLRAHSKIHVRVSEQSTNMSVGSIPVSGTDFDRRWSS